MSVFVTSMLLMMGEQSIGSMPTVVVHLSWSEELKVIAYLEQLSGRVASSMGSTPEVATHLSWSEESKVMTYLDHLSGRDASSLGRAAFTSRANCLKMRRKAGAREPPRMQAIARGSWKPPTLLSWRWSSFLLGGGGSGWRLALP